MNPERPIPIEELSEFDDSPYAETHKQREQYQTNLKKQRENDRSGSEKKSTTDKKQTVNKAMFDEMSRRVKAGENAGEVLKDINRRNSELLKK